MATYLVTGCAGFIASKVSEFLLADWCYGLGDWSNSGANKVWRRDDSE